MPKYKATNKKTGQTRIFDWSSPNPPTSEDIKSIFNISGGDANPSGETMLPSHTPLVQPIPPHTSLVLPPQKTFLQDIKDLATGAENPDVDTALATASKYLEQPVSKSIGGKTFSDLAEMIPEKYDITRRVAKLGTGILDWMQTPEGLAVAAAEGLSGGTATPILAPFLAPQFAESGARKVFEGGKQLAQNIKVEPPYTPEPNEGFKKSLPGGISGVTGKILQVLPPELAEQIASGALEAVTGGLIGAKAFPKPAEIAKVSAPPFEGKPKLSAEEFLDLQKKMAEKRVSLDAQNQLPEKLAEEAPKTPPEQLMNVSKGIEAAPLDKTTEKVEMATGKDIIAIQTIRKKLGVSDEDFNKFKSGLGYKSTKEIPKSEVQNVKDELNNRFGVTKKEEEVPQTLTGGITEETKNAAIKSLKSRLSSEKGAVPFDLNNLWGDKIRDLADAVGFYYNKVGGKLPLIIGKIEEESGIHKNDIFRNKVSEIFNVISSFDKFVKDFNAGIVYHGTTEKAAASIMKEGFKPFHFDESMERVFDAINIPKNDRPALAKWIQDQPIIKSFTQASEGKVSNSPSLLVASEFAGSGGGIPRVMENFLKGRGTQVANIDSVFKRESTLAGPPAVVVSKIPELYKFHVYEEGDLRNLANQANRSGIESMGSDIYDKFPFSLNTFSEINTPPSDIKPFTVIPRVERFNESGVNLSYLKSPILDSIRQKLEDTMTPGAGRRSGIISSERGASPLMDDIVNAGVEIIKGLKKTDFDSWSDALISAVGKEYTDKIRPLLPQAYQEVQRQTKSFVFPDTPLGRVIDKIANSKAARILATNSQELDRDPNPIARQIPTAILDEGQIPKEMWRVKQFDKIKDLASELGRFNTKTKNQVADAMEEFSGGNLKGKYSDQVIRLATGFRTYFADLLEQLKKAGVTDREGNLIKELKDYFPHILRRPDILESVKSLVDDVLHGKLMEDEASGKSESTSGGIYSINAKPTPGLRFAEKRYGTLKDLERDPLRAIRIYTDAASKVLFDNPAIKKANALIMQLPDGERGSREALTKSIATRFVQDYANIQPAVWDILKTWDRKFARAGARSVLTANTGVQLLHLGRILTQITPELGVTRTLYGLKNLITEPLESIERTRQSGILQQQTVPAKFKTPMELLDYIGYFADAGNTLAKTVAREGLLKGEKGEAAGIKATREAMRVEGVVSPGTLSSAMEFVPRTAVQFKYWFQKYVENAARASADAYREPNATNLKRLGLYITAGLTAEEITKQTGLKLFHITKYTFQLGSAGATFLANFARDLSNGKFNDAFLRAIKYFTPGGQSIPKEIKERGTFKSAGEGSSNAGFRRVNPPRSYVPRIVLPPR